MVFVVIKIESLLFSVFAIEMAAKNERFLGLGAEALIPYKFRELYYTYEKNYISIYIDS